MDQNQIKGLLKETAGIQQRYRDIETRNGDRFNLFNLLGIERAEVQHSKILAEFLNPKGSHGQGKVYLKAFIDQMGIGNVENLDSAIVETEKYISPNNEAEAGRIDILIRNTNPKIIIENKIDHSDGFEQLYKYHNAHFQSCILYLTLDGKRPGPESYLRSGREPITIQDFKVGLSSFTKAIIQISYQQDILQWLVTCKNLSSSFPLIREFLEHYILTIKKLTHQTRNHEMAKEIQDLVLSSQSNIDAAKEIKKTIEKYEQQILIRTLNQVGSNKDIRVQRFNVKGSFSFYSSKNQIEETGLNYQFNDSTEPNPSKILMYFREDEHYRFESYFEGTFKAELSSLLNTEFENSPIGKIIKTENEIIEVIEYRLSRFEECLHEIKTINQSANENPINS